MNEPFFLSFFLFWSFVPKKQRLVNQCLFLVRSLSDSINRSPRWSKCVCVCFVASGGFSICVCVWEGREKLKISTSMEDGQALMDGSVLGRAKCNLTADFNEIYYRDGHFQTRCGVVAPAWSVLSTIPPVPCESTHNPCKWRTFGSVLMGLRQSLWTHIAIAVGFGWLCRLKKKVR